MVRDLVHYPTLLRTTEGTSYTVKACGRLRGDQICEGWLEFFPDDGTPVLRSGTETTQPNLVDLEYWATGLTPIYLEGALQRTLSAAGSTHVSSRS
jgi:hypothetical protein